MKLSRRSLLVSSVFMGLGGLSTQGQWQISFPKLKEVVDKAIEQMRLAISHTLLAAFSVTLSDLKLHACHVLNIIVGKVSSDYDPSCGDPGDGVGLMNYCKELQKLIAESEYKERWAWPAENYLIWLSVVITLLKKARETADANEARQAMRQVLALLKATQGCKDDPATEGGLRTLQARL